MARRRAVLVAEADGTLLLPPDLADPAGLSGGEYRSFWRARNDWLRQHGIDPGDWSAVRPILRATALHYGIPDALEQTRLRLRTTEGV